MGEFRNKYLTVLEDNYLSEPADEVSMCYCILVVYRNTRILMTEHLICQQARLLDEQEHMMMQPCLLTWLKAGVRC